VSGSAGTVSTGGISPALIAMHSSSRESKSMGPGGLDGKELANIQWDNVGTKDTITTTTSKNDDGSERKIKVRGVRVILPQGKGSLNMSLHKYNTAGALKNEVWETIKKRAMLDLYVCSCCTATLHVAARSSSDLSLSPLFSGRMRRRTIGC
jgi:hypothetical protein